MATCRVPREELIALIDSGAEVVRLQVAVVELERLLGAAEGRRDRSIVQFFSELADLQVTYAVKR